MKRLAILAVLLLPLRAFAYCDISSMSVAEFERCSERERDEQSRERHARLDKDEAQHRDDTQQRRIDELEARIQKLERASR